MYFNPIHATRIMIVYSLYSDCFGSIPAPDVNIGGIRWSYAHAETRCLRTRIALVLTHAFSSAFLSYWSCDYISFISVLFKSLISTATNANAHTMSSVCLENRLLKRGPVASGRTSKCCARGTATGSKWPVCVQKATSNNRSAHLATSRIAWPHGKSPATHAGVQ